VEAELSRVSKVVLREYLEEVPWGQRGMSRDEKVEKNEGL
jgi:hypothetical protein